MARFYLTVGMTLAILSSVAFADSVSVGTNGINAVGLLRPDGLVLTGDEVNIGQVEPDRVAVRGPDRDSDANSNAFVIPFESKIKNGTFTGNDIDVGDGHALRVASVMIGATGAPRSVSPRASLYSSGFVTLGINPGYQDALITTQYIAKRFQFGDTRRIRAINHSWSKLTPDGGDVEGNSLLTLGMDWIASKFDVLNVISGAQDSRSRRVPSDNFNGITVARSETVGGVFKKVEQDNENDGFYDAAGMRVSVDLMAPGVNITVADAGVGNPTSVRIGTSYAAPHVTGTVALLNEYADYQVENSGSFRWNVDNTRTHEVMKAVLLNSADKKDGVHGSRRDVVNEDDIPWTQSTAFMDDEISLDQQMGAGHLNAGRALQQFRSGEYGAGESIPNIGWDYGDAFAGNLLSYPLAVPFGGGFVAVTLAWDRGVTKFGGTDNTYNPTDIFMGQQVADLDLFILPMVYDDLVIDAVARSVSAVDNVEHIFKDIPAGNYQIVVRPDNELDVDFGLAWWFGDAPPVIPGDFDGDGNVDGDDLTDWRGSFGPSGGADADGDGDSDGADFLTWQQSLGMGVPTSPTAAAVPEPAAWMLCAIGLPLLLLRRTS